MLYARLIADQLEATSGKIDFASVGALPAGLDEIYAENFRRVFVDDAAWRDALPLVEFNVCRGRRRLPSTRRVVRSAGIGAVQERL